MSDTYQFQAHGLNSPLIGAFAVVPNDAADLPRITRQIRVTGQGGTVAVVWFDGAETAEPVSAGETLDWRIIRVKSSGTTATGLRGYY